VDLCQFPLVTPAPPPSGDLCKPKNKAVSLFRF